MEKPIFKQENKDQKQFNTREFYLIYHEETLTQYKSLG